MALILTVNLMLLFWLRITVCVATQSSNPSILFILADDLGWANVGYHNNNGEVSTPNIDYLVKNGLELNSHYAHYVCSPTRSSVQSGRLPVHVHLQNTAMNVDVYSGIPPNMTCIAERLKNDRNYYTAFVGKWDAGSTVIEQTPYGRGYMSSFGYLNHMNDYWNEKISNCSNQYITDLWNTTQPAYNQNGTGMYEESIFANHVYDHIQIAAQNKDQPFFIFYASHIAHSLMQIPKQYLLQFDNDEGLCQNEVFNGRIRNPVYPGFNISSSNWHCRSIYQSMVNYLDLIIGNITLRLKQNGLWDNTLIVFSADNGGDLLLSATAGNNNLLRGGKFVPFEGGIRVNAFVSGGYLPQNRRGKIENGRLHICDWYSTFCNLVGLDPTDQKAAKAGLPPIDSLNMWPMISGENMTSPRTQIYVDNNTLIDGDYKLINQTIVDYASWGGIFYPNSSSNGSLQTTTLDCMQNGCLFDIVHDRTEHVNIINENMDIALQMNNKLNELKKTFYSNNERGIKMCPSNINTSCQCWAAINVYNGFWGPSEYLPNSTMSNYLLNHA